jgi:alkanesulfonate monooxygenase SsuD/methylene tetrahydromethanopterin reductase-like flavin-dependent oxidoreductase (luciferase family)
MNAADLQEYRRKHVPVFNDNKMKLGVFGSNVSGGGTITFAERSFTPTYQHNVAIAKKADELGLEMLIPFGRWKSLGGKTEYNGDCMEVYTWATAMATQTEHIMVFATSHVPTVHPIVAAKQGATIDQISNGRWGLNIVCGWYTEEMEMFGAPQMAHDDRYRYAGEWFQVVKRLWTEQHFDHAGEFFHIKDGYLLPKPVQKPYPVVINAGISPAGRDFSAREVDINFISIDRIENGQATVDDIKQRARSYNREVGIMSYLFMLCRDTEREAKQAYQYILDQGDWDAAYNIMRILGVESESFGSQIRDFASRFIAGWGGYPIVGSPEQVVDELLRLSKIGVEGAVILWHDYLPELTHFGEKVLPLMRQAGLRT